MAIVKLSPAEKRRASAFLSCLVLAAIAWVFAVLSNPHNFTVAKIIVYKNAPQKRAFHPLQSDTVKATVKGSGWQMLFARLNDQNNTIGVNLSSLDKHNYVVLSNQLRNINLKQESNRQIIAFDPDTLYFDFSNRRVKRVPVKLVKSLKYKQQFAQSADIAVKPDYVTLSGPAEMLNTITSWKTDTLRAENVNETINTQVKLQPVKEGNMSVYPKTVQVNIPVDEFTEKTLAIPVKIINNRHYYNVKVYPQKVKITFVTSLTDYPDMDEAFFEATADLDLWQLHGYRTLPVKLRRLPPYCKIVKIEPANIDFIIKK
ncbi:YbbR-like domain-containing protein [Mucilaginibacter hurinus]|uniref:YbbR-like domain-containing protein n=1 Tax=Mucilaginibacter hurinus TaxID=2201324 RepID=A0A367GKN7_9SPHI|nr:YbbR-like domain-containing protein [Mucilaginibacter hurinus]RCH54029.1 YbbR-like domain-containing protein [Mucilaginibacter hurinus]